MRSLSLLVVLLTLFPTVAQVPRDQGKYEALHRQAEASYQEKSFARALQAYEEAGRLELTPAQRRWVDFRLADTAWRSVAVREISDPTQLENARSALEKVVRESGEDHDRIWAEANESLGDLHRAKQPWDQHGAWPFYSLALDWWAGSDDLVTARRRYLDIVFRGDAAREHYRHGGGSVVPEDILINAVAIAVTPAERAHARYLLATRLLSTNEAARVERGLELLETVIRAGKGSEFFDDALMTAAQRLMQGAPVVGADGTVRIEPDMRRALGHFRRLVSEFPRGTSPYVDEATAAISMITSPSVTVMIPGTFLPQSEQEVIVSWRNTRNVTVNIFAIDLLENMEHGRNHSWWRATSTASRKLVRTIEVATNDPGDHVPGNNRVRLTPKLGRGAYVVEVAGGAQSTRQLLLVTSANVTLHATASGTNVFVCDAETGRPYPGARVRVASFTDDSKSAIRDLVTGGNGLVPASFERSRHSTIVAAAVTPDGSPAFATTSVYEWRRSGAEWRIHAFTDRSAYRPGETVQWKSIVRTRLDDAWTTPAGEELEYDITSPRGEKVASGRAALNSFGTFSSELQLTPDMPLGLYQVQFRTMRGSDRNVGSATLFRLEEYKLPEFRVEVTTRGADEKPRQYRLGETVTATIEANYYFGGPVANASVEVVVFRRPFFRHWSHSREYPWYWEDGSRGNNEEVKRETLRTDAAGRAVVMLETSRDQADAVFTIEARVTDASRREVAGQGTVRVTKHRYAVAAQPERYIHRPGDKVTVAFKATDANDLPVSTTGNVTVVRKRWNEVWVNRDGREIGRAELDRLRVTTPPANRGLWRRKVATYVEEVVLTRTVTTDAAGEGSITFEAPRVGYYAVRWSSEDGDAGRPTRVRDLVTAETTVWVTDESSADIGYSASGLEIVVDKESFRAGQTATMMIVAPASGQWVLLTTDLGQSAESQVIHLDGTAKVVRIPVDARHVPSFHVIATSVLNRTELTANKQVLVPPVEHFITVDVQPSAEKYEPRSSGEVTVTTHDTDGKPVSAEVALAVTDDAVSAIQTDLAGDPRQFFFGELRPQRVQVSTSVSNQRYVNLVEHSGQLIDDRDVARHNLAKERGDLEELQSSSDGAPPPPMPAAPRMMRAQAGIGNAVSEAITVTAAVSAPMEAKSAEHDNAQMTPGIDVQVRSDFRSTAFWKPDVLTGNDGRAVVKVVFPESLTTWRMTARAVSQRTQVGIASATARTTMPLVVRLQAPRFFVEGDEATISAIINNNTDAAMMVTPSLEAEGVTAVGDISRKAVDVAAHGEVRADWVVKASHAGPAKLRVAARTAGRGDAMERTFTVYEHGIEKLLARSGKLRGDEAVIQLDLPRERRDTSLIVQVQPSLAVAMLDALPYLIHFPYGCTEQTMSRFLPAAIVARTLAANGLGAKQVEGRAFGGIEPSSAATTHPDGAQPLARIGVVTASSMTRLYDFQHADGGWGWWKDGESDDFMTAYVVWGFAVAKEGGLSVNDGRLERAIAYLDRRLVQHERDLHMRTWLLHAMASWKFAAKSGTPSPNQAKAFDDVWQARERLSSYSRALLALTAHASGSAERAAVLIRNLEDGVRIDSAPDKSILLRGSGSNAPEVMATAHWGEARGWWQWHQGAVESTSFALRALLRIDPKNKLIEPATNWLVKNRRGAQWNNTRDTAIALLALTDYLKTSGELSSDGAYEVTVNGRAIDTQRITRDNILGAPARFAVDAELVRDANEIRIRRTAGRSPLYFAVEGRFFSLEEPVKPAGNELFVRRDYFRMAPKPTLLKGVSYDRVPLRDQQGVNSGERVEVVLTIETKNDYEYLLFEDLKPAGLEATGLQSGAPIWATELRAATVTRKFAAGDPAGEQPTVVQRRRSADTTPRTAWVYQELRDRHVALFIDHLPQGTWEIRYTLRAEVPGKFHALPLLGQAMYVPEIRANGEEVRMEVRERE